MQSYFWLTNYFLFVCCRLFVCLFVVDRPTYRWGAAKFDLCLALTTIEQWWFFSVTHLLWHGASVYNNHPPQGPVTLTPIAGREAAELSPPVFTTSVCRGWDSYTQCSACMSNALIHCATVAVTNFHTNNVIIKNFYNKLYIYRDGDDRSCVIYIIVSVSSLSCENVDNMNTKDHSYE